MDECDKIIDECSSNINSSCPFSEQDVKAITGFVTNVTSWFTWLGRTAVVATVVYSLLEVCLFIYSHWK